MRERVPGRHGLDFYIGIQLEKLGEVSAVHRPGSIDWLTKPSTYPTYWYTFFFSDALHHSGGLRQNGLCQLAPHCSAHGCSDACAAV